MTAPDIAWAVFIGSAVVALSIFMLSGAAAFASTMWALTKKNLR